MNNRRIHIRTALVVSALLVSSGCAIYTPVAEFTGQRYTNAIAYFNTFYNAQRLFQTAEDEYTKARREQAERGPSAKTFAIPVSARQKFQTSIEKNSKILSFYSASKWVDDALLMIGKAYFYMEDDVRAERKFLELAVQFPASELIPESQLWLGKSYIRQKKYDAGINQLEDVFNKTDGSDDDLAGRAAYELGQYYFSADDFIQAEKHYSLAADRVDDDELTTQIYFQIGKCFTEQQQFERAQVAYGQAAAQSRVYTLMFQAKLQQVKTMAARRLFDDAIAALNDLLDDSKNTEFFGIIHFEYATILYEQGRINEAVAKYRYVDTAFAKTDESARSNFLLARHYESVNLNYDSAQTLYFKAKMEFPSSAITAEAVLKSDVFNKYATLRYDLNRFDSLYRLGMYGPPVADSLPAARSGTSDRKDSIMTTSVDSVLLPATPALPAREKDSTGVVDSIKIRMQQQNELAKRVMLDSLQRSIVRTKFELGGLFFLEIQQPDSALYWFHEVVSSPSASEFAPRAYYTIAEIYRTVKQAPRAVLDTMYQFIIRAFPESPYANEARKIIGLPVFTASVDSAQIYYEQAEELAEQSKNAAALKLFTRIGNQYPSSPFAAKAHYAAGWLYEHALQNNDSAFAWYKRLITAHPVSAYAAAVKSKVTEFESEQKRKDDEKKKAADDAKQKSEKKTEKLKDLKINPSPAPKDTIPKP